MVIGTAKRNKEGSKPLPTRHFSKLQENTVAKAIGGKRTPNSGFPFQLFRWEGIRSIRSKAG